MKQHLQLVLFLQLTKICLPQTCYTQCLQHTSASATAINVMLSDGDEYFSLQYTRQWYQSKTAEFNALYPAISVELSHVQYENMVTQAEEDLEQGTNLYQAYLIPFLNIDGGTSRLSGRLMDMSVFTVNNVNNIQWHTIGRFFRSHAALYEGKVLTLPLSGDFISLYYRRDLFTTYGLTVPRTLEEYVVASQVFNSTDLNGDGEPDYGSCFPHAGDGADFYFFAWISQVLQYRGTSQGSTFDTETLAPLLENPAVQEAIKLWKLVAGPPETTGVMTDAEAFNLWYTGRCAMILANAALYMGVQNTVLDDTTGVTTMPGSERVWWREGNETIKCSTSFCRHATEYPDGAVVNHAPVGQSTIDGAINGQIEMDQRLAAFTYLTWLMSDTNMVEAVVNPPSWPNFFLGTLVKPSLFVPSDWTPFGWRDPAVSMVCATAVSNMNHPNAVIGWRLPNAQEYFAAMKEILIAFWRGTDDFKDLDQEVGASVVSSRLSAALEEVTDRGDREALIVTYQKSLNIYVKAPTLRREYRGDIIPNWAVHTIAGMLGGTVCLASSFALCWLISTVLQRHRLRTQQQEKWESIVDEAETYATSLGCPMALVSAENFLDLGCIAHFEAIRDADILRTLDTVEKVAEFKRKFVIVFLSHWLALTTPDPNTVHFETMCAAVRRATKIANVNLDRVFLWVDRCSIPQEHVATRELFLAAVPMYAMLCDIFIVVAPPPIDDDSEAGISTHFRGGWCRAEFLARLVGSGVHNLFFCESCDGFLEQVTLEMVQSIDLNVFSGDFRCCSFRHVGCSLCDREKLRTPILGVYAQYLKMLMCGPGPTDGAMPFVVQMDQDRERLLPTVFDFVQEVDDMTTFTQVRELFGPLPEILEHRIKASWTKRNAQALRSTTAPTLELGQNPRGRSSVDEGAGVNSRNESSGLPQVRADIDKREVTDLDLLWQREHAAGGQSEESPGRLPMNVTKPEPLRLERGQGSSIVVDRNDTHVLQHIDSQDWVVADLRAPSEADERQLETTREPSRNEVAQNVAKELTSSSTSTEHVIESELL